MKEKEGKKEKIKREYVIANVHVMSTPKRERGGGGEGGAGANGAVYREGCNAYVDFSALVSNNQRSQRGFANRTDKTATTLCVYVSHFTPVSQHVRHNRVRNSFSLYIYVCFLSQQAKPTCSTFVVHH